MYKLQFGIVMTVIEQQAAKSTEKSRASASLGWRCGKTLQWQRHQGWALFASLRSPYLGGWYLALPYLLHPRETNVWNTAPRSRLIFSLRPQEKSESRLSARGKICLFP